MYDYKNTPFTKGIGKEIEKKITLKSITLLNNNRKISDFLRHTNPLRDCTIKPLYAAFHKRMVFIFVHCMPYVKSPVHLITVKSP